jgi:N-methylhydantoinase A
MFQEGYQLTDCSVSWQLSVETESGDVVELWDYQRGDTVEVDNGHRASLRLAVAAELPHPVLADDARVTLREAVSNRTRQVGASAEHVDDVRVFLLDEQEPGAGAVGPAIVEGPFFTARVPAGWRFDVTSNRDLILVTTD